MVEYIVEIDNPNGTRFFRADGRDVFRSNERDATRFKSYFEAVQQIAEILHRRGGSLGEPVEIHVLPVPDPGAQTPVAADDDEWSIEDILRNAG
jgi:hypothetical protein